MSVLDEIREKLGDKILDWQGPSPKRIYISLDPANLKEAAQILFKRLNCRFATATGIDTPQGLEILYHFSFDQTGTIFSLRILLKDKKKPEVDSLAPLFPAAEWIEREIWEMLGVNFIGHPNLKHLLLIDDWPEGKYPLRKEEK